MLKRIVKAFSFVIALTKALLYSMSLTLCLTLSFINVKPLFNNNSLNNVQSNAMTFFDSCFYLAYNIVIYNVVTLYKAMFKHWVCLSA